MPSERHWKRDVRRPDSTPPSAAPDEPAWWEPLTVLAFLALVAAAIWAAR